MNLWNSTYKQWSVPKLPITRKFRIHNLN